MKNDFQSRSTSAAADQAAGQSASDLQPLGVTAQAGATVAIYAELPSDATVYVVPTQFYGESGVWKGTSVALENGRNYITVQQIGSLGGRGGPLYITYSGSHPEQIMLQVRVVNNAWEMPVLELSRWYSMGESARKDAIRTYVQELSSYVAALPTSATGKGNWGIAHEIGHNMDKLGKAEITNNIYSLALQAWDGSSMALNTRLTEDGRWETIFNKVAQGRPGSANNEFVQLGMYWQLHLAYDEADQPLEIGRAHV